MWTALLIVLSLAGTDGSAAQDLLNCRATHSVSCMGAECKNEADEQLHVTLTLKTASGAGELCTFTYCRDFMLLPAPGRTMEQTVTDWTGYTLSTRRGSVGEDAEHPAVDFQLSLSKDRARFMLGNLADGGFSGWSGTCGP